MLNPDQRTLYTQCLRAPDGYRFDSGVATTFTLNLETLLILPFTLATQREDDPERLLLDPVSLLEALRETSDRLLVFCHEGYIAVPPTEQLLYGLLEDCVVPVRARNHDRGIFHPKLWLLRYVSDECDRPLLRAVVLSRNLTFDRSWDTVLVLEGEPTGKRVRSSYGLAELVDTLPQLTSNDLGKDRNAIIAQLASEVRHTAFDAPAPFVGRAQFHSIGTSEKATFNPDAGDYCGRVMCISPFLSTDAVRRAAALATTDKAERILISREDQLNAVNPTALEAWDKIYILADEADSDETSDADAESASGDLSRMSPPNGLHAKMVVAEYGDKRTIDATWWIGSANLGTAAWDGRNVELMVELSGKCKVRRGTPVGAGIDAFLHSGFSSLLSEYVRSEPDPEAVAREKALALADDVRVLLTNPAAKLRLSADGSEDQYDLIMNGHTRLPDDTKAVAWPVTLSESTHAQALDATSSEHMITWPAVAAASLTSMIAFAVTAEYERTTVTVRFVIKLETNGFPDDRHARIVRQIISNQDGFFRYLRLLLSEEGAPPEESTAFAESGASGDGSALAFLSGGAVLEDLLRTLSRDPGRLDAVDRLIRDLCETEEGSALIPPDFMSLWETFQAFRSAR